MRVTRDYLALRESACDGDTVAVLATGLYAAALRLGCMGPVGHVGMIRRVTIDNTVRVMVVEESTGGGRYKPLSHYGACALSLYRAPAGVDGRVASGCAVTLLDGLARYAWDDIARLLWLGLRRRTAAVMRRPLPTALADTLADGGMICSALVCAAYARAGWAIAGQFAYPSALVDQLGEPVLAYAPEPL